MQLIMRSNAQNIALQYSNYCGREIYLHVPSHIRMRMTWWIGLQRDHRTDNWTWSDGFSVNRSTLTFRSVNDPYHVNKCGTMYSGDLIASDWCLLPLPYLCEKR